MTTFVERAVAQASGVKVSRVILTILAAPFYLLGLVVGVFVVIAVLAFGAARLGVSDVRGRVESARGGDDGGGD